MNISELTIGHIGQRIQVEDKKRQTQVSGTLFGICVETDKLDSSTIMSIDEEPFVGQTYLRLDIGFQERVALSEEATFILEGEK